MIDPIKLLYERIRKAQVRRVGIHREPPFRFRASEAANCWRQIGYRLDGWKPAAVTPEFEMMGTQGSVDHDVIRQLFNHYKIQLGGITTDAEGNTDETIEKTCEVIVETPGGGQYPVSIAFRADGEIETEMGLCLLEIKTMSHFPYQQLQKAFETGGQEAAVARIAEKHPRYYWQIMLTMFLANRFLGKKYKYAYFVARDRNFSQWGVGKYEQELDKLTGKLKITNTRTGLHIPYDQAIVDHVLQRYALVVRRLGEGEMPSQEYSAGSDECKKYCPFLYACHGADDRAAKKLEPVIVYPEEEQIEDLCVRPDSTGTELQLGDVLEGDAGVATPGA